MGRGDQGQVANTLLLQRQWLWAEQFPLERVTVCQAVINVGVTNTPLPLLEQTKI